MKIEEIRIDSFGGLSRFSLELSPDFQIIYGANESGKTTTQTFVKVMFYGFERGGRSLETNERKRYLPWDGSPMRGVIIFEHQGQLLRLERFFGIRKSEDQTHLFREVNGEEIALDNPDQPGLSLFRVSYEEFLNTVFVQTPAIEPAHSAELNRKMNQQIGRAEYDWSYEEISERLKRARRFFKSDRGRSGDYYRLQDELEILQKELDQALGRDRDLTLLAEQELQIKEKLAELEQRKHQLNGQKELHHHLREAERYERYQRIKRQLERQKEQAEQTKAIGIKKMSISAQELTQIANQRMQVSQARSQAEIAAGILQQKLDDEAQFKQQARSRISDIVGERDRLARLQQQQETRDPHQFKAPAFSYAMLLPLIVVDIFCLIGGLLFRTKLPVLSQVLIVFAALLPLLIVLFYFFLQKRQQAKLKQYQDQIRKFEIQKLQLENRLQKLEWELSHFESEIDQLRLSREQAETQEAHYHEVYEREMRNLKLLIKPYFERIPDDDMLDLAVQQLRESAITNLSEETSLEQLQLKMNELTLGLSEEELLQLYRKSQRWIMEHQREYGTFPELSLYQLDSQLEGIQEDLIAWNERLAHVQADLRNFSDEVRDTADLQRETNARKQRLAAIERRLSSLKLAELLMTQGRDQFEQHVRPRLNQLAAEYMSAMTGEKYDDVRVGSHYQMRLKDPADQNFHDQAYFSSGVYDQMNLALRLALTDLIQDETMPLPLILDDPLIQLDAERAERTLTAIRETAGRNRRQVILFTSQESLLATAQKQTIQVRSLNTKKEEI